MKTKMTNNYWLSKVFLLSLVVLSLGVCFFLFRPFMSELLLAAVLASVFDRPYEWLAKKLWNHRKTASLIMCLVIVTLVIIPLANLFVLAAGESVTVYSNAVEFFNKSDWGAIQDRFASGASRLGVDPKTLQGMVVDAIQQGSNIMVNGAAGIVKGTASAAISVLLVFIALFFFFLDGKRMLNKLMYWTPIPSKYDREIFQKFRDIGNSFFTSSFLIAIGQGFACWLGFFLCNYFFHTDLPAVFAGLSVAFLTIIPFVGAWPVWILASCYLFIIGLNFAGLFLILWGILIINPIDNVLRTIIMQKKAQVHPVLIFFAILGGIVTFGFWGVIIGPLVVTVAMTVFHIYEIEYKDVLEK